MAGSAEKSGRDARRRALAHGAEGVEKDTFAHTIPLISIWLPMLLVVGLVIVTGVTTSHVALGGAVVALVLATFAVVNGVVRLANKPPEDETREHEAAARERAEEASEPSSTGVHSGAETHA